MLQRYLKGNSYRLVVLAGKLIGVLQRRAAEVTGDGVQSVKALIEQANNDPRRGIAPDSVLHKISLSGAVELLGRDGIKAVPKAGETVRVNAIDNMSSGGDAINVTSLVHPTWRKAAVRITEKAGLFVSGYDVICDDISQPMPTPTSILEMNSMPSFKLLHFPTAGEPINAAAMLLDAVFPTQR
jgi:cyanophycin synthetase